VERDRLKWLVDRSLCRIPGWWDPVFYRKFCTRTIANLKKFQQISLRLAYSLNEWEYPPRFRLWPESIRPKFTIIRPFLPIIQPFLQLIQPIDINCKLNPAYLRLTQSRRSTKKESPMDSLLTKLYPPHIRWLLFNQDRLQILHGASEAFFYRHDRILMLDAYHIIISECAQCTHHIRPLLKTVSTTH